MIPKRRTDNMYRNLVLYRNELKNTVVPRYKTIGIVAELLMSKEIFSKNTEISDFLSAVFSTKYKEYQTSRTFASPIGWNFAVFIASYFEQNNQ